MVSVSVVNCVRYFSCSDVNLALDNFRYRQYLTNNWPKLFGKGRIDLPPCRRGGWHPQLIQCFLGSMWSSPQTGRRSACVTDKIHRACIQCGLKCFAVKVSNTSGAGNGHFCDLQMTANVVRKAEKTIFYGKCNPKRRKYTGICL